MAKLESVLKIRDQFSNTINKMTSSMQQAASSGDSASASMSSGMDKVSGAINRTKDFFQKFADERRSTILEWERENPPDLHFALENYGEITGQLEYLETKKKALSNQSRLLEKEIEKLNESYNRFLQEGDIPEAQKAYESIQKANVQMSNLGLSTYKIREQMKRFQQEGENVKQEIAQCEKEQQTFNKAIQMACTFAENVKAKFDGVKNAVGSAKEALGKTFGVLHSIKNSIFGSGGGIGGYLKAFLGIAALKKGMEGTIGAGAALQQQLNSVVGLFGNGDIGKSYFNRLQQYAVASGQSISDLMAVTQQFLSVTRNTDHLMGLNNIAEKLFFKNQNQGMEGASYAINEALSGQFSSLKSRFNLSSTQLEPIKQAVAKGNMEGIIAAFNDTLATAGITDQVIEGFRQSVPSQLSSILNSVKSKFANAGMGAFDNLQPVLTQIQEWLNSSGADQFFAVIGNGLSMMTQAVAWLGQKVSENWNIIQPILIALGILAAVVGAVMLVSWVLSMAPLVILVSLIAVFIMKLREAGVKTEEIVEFIGGAFGVLASTVGNSFVTIWNLGVSLAEFLCNVFIDPAYAIKKLFYDVCSEVLKFFDNLVQGIVSGINWVIDKINAITGSNLATVQVDFVSKWIDNLESKKSNHVSDKDIVDLGHLKMEYIDGGSAFDMGASTGAKLFNTVTESIDNFSSNEGAWNSSQNSLLENIAKDTGNISNSIDISNEELKYFRDIAEREAINKFTQNTIVPKIEVKTGDIHKEADADEIIDKIVGAIEEAFDIGPEGVHS